MRTVATTVPLEHGARRRGRPEIAAEAATLLSSELLAVGVNWTLAPVVDVNNNPRNPVIGTRAYSDDPAVVAAYAAAAVRAYQSAGLLACAKHFPGHGDTDVDSHIGLPRMDARPRATGAAGAGAVQGGDRGGRGVGDDRALAGRGARPEWIGDALAGDPDGPAARRAGSPGTGGHRCARDGRGSGHPARAGGGDRGRARRRRRAADRARPGGEPARVRGAAWAPCGRGASRRSGSRPRYATSWTPRRASHPIRTCRTPRAPSARSCGRPSIDSKRSSWRGARSPWCVTAGLAAVAARSRRATGGAQPAGQSQHDDGEVDVRSERPGARSARAGAGRDRDGDRVPRRPGGAHGDRATRARGRGRGGRDDERDRRSGPGRRSWNGCATWRPKRSSSSSACARPYEPLVLPWLETYVCAYSSVEPSMIATAEVLFGEQPARGRLPVRLD